MTRSHWRFATSAGLVAAALMLNAGGAMAFAEPNSSTSTGAEGAGPTSPSVNQNDPIGSLTKAVHASIQGAAGALNPGNLVRPQPTVGSTTSAIRSSIVTVPQMMSDAIRVHAPVTGVSAPRQDLATPTIDRSATVAADAEPNSPTTLNDGSGAVTSLTTAVGATTNQVAQATTAWVAPATTALTSGVQSVVAPVAAGIATVTAPLPDVLSSIQAVLTATADAVVPFTQLPSNLAALFGITGVTPISGPVNTDTRRSGPAALPALLPAVQPLAGSSGEASDIAASPAPVNPTPTASVTSALAGASSLNASARTAPVTAMPEGLQKFWHSYGAFVVAASLTAMIAAALPGLAALLIPTAAGVGVGYRQAKAGTALRASGIARFAGSGPVGIVRSGSLVSLRSGALRIPRSPRTARSARPAVSDNSHIAA